MTEPTLTPEMRPRLPRGVRLKFDEARQGWVLLAPERVIKCNESSVEIIKRCSGSAPIGSIVDDLTTVFSADRGDVERDVMALVKQLAGKRLMDFD